MKKTASGILVPSDYQVTSPGRSQSVRIARSRYDAAQTSVDNAKHWSMADSLSPDAANNAGVRRILRNRARYEVANNTYARGIVNTLANYVIGTTPQIQILTDDDSVNDFIEEEFMAWAEEIDFAQKLRTMRKARCVDGEAFAIFINNPKLESRVKLDIRIIECDMVTSPLSQIMDLYKTDGIDFDQYGNRTFYHILDEHPGGGMFASGLFNTKKYPADMVIHWYRMDRPGQNRGIPEITSSLPLFAQLRRYTLAVIAAAETAADFAAVLEATGPAVTSDTIEAMDVLELEKRMATVLPEGWKLNQVDAKQPTNTYGEFKGEIINEIARCMDVPYNIAAGNSSKYNYASGRLDDQSFEKSVSIDRHDCKTVVLNPVFRKWKDEAVLIEGYLPQSCRTRQRIRRDWMFDGKGHVDPQKEANAQDIRLRNFSTNYASEFARQGKDWKKELQQAADEQAFLSRLNLTLQDANRQLAKTKGDRDADEEE